MKQPLLKRGYVNLLQDIRARGAGHQVNLAEAIGEGVLSADVYRGVTARMFVAVVQGGFVLSRVTRTPN